jgi:hypothetical protein
MPNACSCAFSDTTPSSACLWKLYFDTLADYLFEAFQYLVLNDRISHFLPPSLPGFFYLLFSLLCKRRTLFCILFSLGWISLKSKKRRNLIHRRSPCHVFCLFIFPLFRRVVAEFSQAFSMNALIWFLIMYIRKSSFFQSQLTYSKTQ